MNIFQKRLVTYLLDCNNLLCIIVHGFVYRPKAPYTQLLQ